VAMQEGPPGKWPQRGDRESQNTEHSLPTFRPHRNLGRKPQIPATLHCKYTAEHERFNPQMLITGYLCLIVSNAYRYRSFEKPAITRHIHLHEVIDRGNLGSQ
jgi:hypothetical protein